MLCLIPFAIPAAAQISPGALSRPHQTLSGATGCTACHGLSTGRPAFRCIDCHGEIGSRIAARKGLHASYSIKPGSSQECISCHSEHNGEDFALVKWDLKIFDHRHAGYGLEGKHAALACNRCHTADRVAPNQRSIINVKDLNRTFLGLSQSCSSCHQDQHKGRLGSGCLQCHNYNDWKTVRLANLDHSKTRYPLTGLHAEVSCQKCHAPGSDGQPQYAGIAFSECADCHSDPHQGGFAQTCESCHGTAGWRKPSAHAPNEGFDHSKTKFPLLGKHAAVECVQCHAGGDFKKPIVFQKCMDCHKSNPHGGQLSKRADGGECSSCHTVAGFKPSTFGVKEHAATAYPLQGKHASVPCGHCHIPKGKATLYDIKFQSCTDCHKDPHAAQFAAAPYLSRCERCHSLQRFQPSTFGLARHQETKYPLSGSHKAVVCGDCHKLSTEFKPPTALYHWRNSSCTGCHADPHQGEFDNLMRHDGSDGKLSGCEACHSTRSWKGFSRFDHSRTSFSLLGSHLTTPCSACHKVPNQQTAPAKVNFKTAPAQCEACHEDIHGAQFARSGVTRCVECHNSTQWKPSLFDHDLRTSFALQGAHRKARCEGCHKATRGGRWQNHSLL
jgi:Cytochrome c7 and related cytochrome c